MKTMITKNWRHLLIVSLTSALFALASVASATYYGYIVERSHNKDVTLFFMMIVAGLTVVLLRYMFDVINQTLMVKFVGSIVSAFRQKTMARITANQVSDFGQNKVSAYTSNLLNDVELLEINLVEPFFDLLSQVIIVIISSAVILYYQPTVFLIILLGSTLVFLIPTLMSQKLQEKQSALSEQSEHLTAAVTDILNGFATVKATQTLPYFFKRFPKNESQLYPGENLIRAMDHVKLCHFGHAGDVCAVCRRTGSNLVYHARHHVNWGHADDGANNEHIGLSID